MNTKLSIICREVKVNRKLGDDNAEWDGRLYTMKSKNSRGLRSEQRGAPHEEYSEKKFHGV